MAWTREPTYDKPDISVRATTLYYEIVAPIMLPFLDRRLLNLFRCREGKCFFQRNREHPPTGKEFDRLVHLEPVIQKNGRTEQYLYVESVEEIVGCAKVQTVEFHGWGSRARSVETPDRLVTRSRRRLSKCNGRSKRWDSKASLCCRAAKAST
jgi:DNA primase